MKRVAIAALKACAVMALADVFFVLLAANCLPEGTPIFPRVALSLGPGFLALGSAYLLCAPRSRAHVPITLALLLVRFLVFDHLFLAPKREELNRDMVLTRSAGQPVSNNYYLAAGAVYQASLAAGTGCLAAALLAFVISGRSLRPMHRPAVST